MFDRVAARYDLANDVLSLGQDRAWRRRTVEAVDARPGQRVLDLAAGTGTSSEPFDRAGATVVATDLSLGMLEVGKRRRPSLAFVAGDALRLPYGDGEFAACTVGFGARNFSDLERGLAEMARVVCPGGRVVVLEITTPTRPPLSTFYRLWFDRVVPVIGRLAGDPEAYSYLPSSVKRFPGPRELAARMDGCGLDVRCILTAGGIIALHAGTKRR